ncbi:MAG TPA: pyrroline-5-carboxylate reductase [Acidimicrobiales bacterium]|nr:pyrroline-5-carboxylate reductase [Acidimicrobiales bacterium]
MTAKLLVVGAGKMGEALLAGVLSSGWASADEVAVCEVSAVRRQQLVAPGALLDRYRGVTLGDGPIGPAQGAVVAVKPADVRTTCEALRAAGVPRVLSIAAGVRLAELESWCGPDVAVIRAMPNTPAQVGAGATALSKGARASEEDLQWAVSLMSSVGLSVTVPEKMLDAVTGLSGSGPAYVFLVAEALIEGGVLAGLPRPTARDLAVQTLLGAARMMAETGELPEVLRAGVTSPGGTTAAGLRRLEAAATRSAFIEAVAAAAARSQELG